MGLKVKYFYWACFVCLLLSSSGCKPEGIIPPREMETLFAEFFRADACIETYNATSREGPLRLDSLYVYLPILERHGYTKDEFRASMTYYLHHPDDLSAMFDRVHDRLEKDLDAPSVMDRLDAEESEEKFIEEKPALAPDKEPAVEEGVEPAIEKEGKKLDKKKELPEAEEKVIEKPARKNARKRMTKEDLKRLEEELK